MVELDIESYIYFCMTGMKESVINFISEESDSDELFGYYRKFNEAFKNIYDVKFDNVIFKKKDAGEVERLLDDENEYEKIYEFVIGKSGNYQYIMENIYSSYEYGINFIHIFNEEHRIIGYEKITLLAAGTNGGKNGEYILKNFEFQNYYYSICRESERLYRFEILSNTGDLENKMIKISIKHSDGTSVCIKEKCEVITEKYVIYYNGVITNETEIIPEISFTGDEI